MAADVADLVRRSVPIDRWMNDGVIDEWHALLAELVPAPGVFLVGIVKSTLAPRVARNAAL
jgi:hypothetical protein